MSDKPMNIYQRLREVMKAVAYIKKDMTVTVGGNYKALSHDMVTATIRPHFLAHGIIVVPRLVSGATVDSGNKTKAGNTIIRYEGIFEVSFVNVDDPTDIVILPIPAHADDMGDKAPGKALSIATKAAILKILMIESGDNEESRVAPEPPPLTPEQEAALKVLRDASLLGSEALKKAWADAGKPTRLTFANELEGLREAATKADKTPERKAA